MKELSHTFTKGILKVIISSDCNSEDFIQITPLIEKYKDIKSLYIDMSRCEYIQSKVLAEIVALKKTSVKNKFDITLLNVSDNIIQVLEMTNIISLFHIKEDLGSYSLDVLVDKFLDDMTAQDVSKYLAANYNDDVKEKLKKVIDEGDPIKTEYAILTMGQAQDFGSIEMFRNALKSGYNNVKIAAILGLGWLGDTESKQELYVYLVNKDADLAAAAAASIALLSDISDAEKLNIYLNHENYKVRMIAVQALSLINDDKSYGFIVKRLEKETNENVRVCLAKWLSFFNIEDVGSILLDLLNDNSIAVRETAASGLARIGTAKYAQGILDKVSDKDSWVGFFATKALSGSKDKNILLRLQELYNVVEPNVKLAIIEVLGKSGVVESNFFISKLKDPNEDIRKEALNALFISNTSDACAEALKLYDKDTNWIVRYKATEIILSVRPEGYENLLKSRLASEDNRYVREKVISTIGE